MQIRKTYLYLQRLTRYIMQNIEQKTPLANNHISVDCVVIGDLRAVCRSDDGHRAAAGCTGGAAAHL